MFFVHLVKMVFVFPKNMVLTLYQKSKYNILPKNTLKDDISSIIEKGDTHPRKYGTSSDRKINMIIQINKDDNKVYSFKYTLGELT